MILVGTDPEIIAVDRHTGVPKCAIGMIEGTKRKPFKTPHGSIQVDCTNLEFNIPPARNAQEFSMYIESVMDDLQNRIAKHDVIFSKLASAVFPEEELKDPMARVAGCEPDYNAWTEPPEANHIPNMKNNLRSAGGHLHVQWPGFSGFREGFTLNNPEDNPGHALRLVRALDYFVTLPSLLIDDDKERRKLYGKAGCFRPKPYGIEYRTPSNFWIFDSNLRVWIYNRVMAAVRFHRRMSWLTPQNPLALELQKAINTDDKYLARELINYDIDDIIDDDQDVESSSGLAMDISTDWNDDIYDNDVEEEEW